MIGWLIRGIHIIHWLWSHAKGKNLIDIANHTLRLNISHTARFWRKIIIFAIDTVHLDSVNSSPPSAAYARQWIGSALVKIMACRLFGAKPLSKSMLDYCQLEPSEQTSVKCLSKYITFQSQKWIWKYCLRNGGNSVQGEMSEDRLFKFTLNSLRPSNAYMRR